MTDWQIERLYLYPRDSSGKLKEPVGRRKGQKELSVEAEIATYLAVAASANQARPGAFPDDVIAATVQEIRRHHAVADGRSGGADGGHGRGREGRSAGGGDV
jgi:hypothetical protein